MDRDPRNILFCDLINLTCPVLYGAIMLPLFLSFSSQRLFVLFVSMQHTEVRGGTEVKHRELLIKSYPLRHNSFSSKVAREADSE